MTAGYSPFDAVAIHGRVHEAGAISRSVNLPVDCEPALRLEDHFHEVSLAAVELPEPVAGLLLSGATARHQLDNRRILAVRRRRDPRTRARGLRDLALRELARGLRAGGNGWRITFFERRDRAPSTR
jgi:hypothetical protein